ncbi:hypothetical protein Dimus_011097 [Dionaea muscipula]
MEQASNGGGSFIKVERLTWPVNRANNVTSRCDYLVGFSILQIFAYVEFLFFVSSVVGEGWTNKLNFEMQNQFRSNKLLILHGIDLEFWSWYFCEICWMKSIGLFSCCH